MSWNKFFWIIFAIIETVIIVQLCFIFSDCLLTTSVLLMILAVPKLAEDSENLKRFRGALLVRKDILNKLKRRDK